MRQRLLRVIRIALAFSLAALGAPRALAQGTAPAAPQEPRVVAVHVVTEERELLEENPAALALQPGAAYRSEAVRESLRQLYRSGAFADVRAEAVDVPGGLRLDFVVRQNFYVNRVQVAGLADPRSESVALSALRLGLGQVFQENQLAEALARVKQAMDEEGFYQAQLAHESTPNPATRQMDLTIRVTPGLRARVGRIDVRSQSHLPEAEILRRAKLSSGATLRPERLERATQRVRKFLVKKGHLGARVNFRRGSYDPPTNTLPLLLEVVAGPRVRVEVTGVKISSRELRKLLPLYQEGAVDEDLLQEGRRDLRDFLESRGYFDSEVRFRAAADAERGQQVITYEVERGPRRRLVGVAFTGNRYFSNELLRGLLHIQPAGLLARGRFSRRLLDDDEKGLRELYLANGFRDVKVRGELIEHYANRGEDLFVRFHIEEGPQARVAELRLAGNQTLSEDFLLSVVGSTPGQPYSEYNVAGDRDNLLALYFNQGFPEARLEWEAEELSSPQAVRLTYRVEEGSQLTVERILLAGQEHTRPGVIRREIELHPGEPLSEGAVVETQRRLYNLGIFSRALLAPQNPGGTDTSKVLVVQVEEAKRYTVAYGLGLEVQRLGGSASDPVAGEWRASPRGLFEITRVNVAGRAHTVSLKTRASSLQKRGLLSYTAPYAFGRRNLDLQIAGFAQRASDVRTFTANTYEASLQTVHKLSTVTTLAYRYAYRQVLVDADTLRVDPNEIPLLSQPTKISSFGISWVRERRNNPANASRGDFNAVDVSVAGKVIGASTDFVRLFVQNSTFHPFGPLVFARSLRLGIEKRYAGAQPTDIPLPERFFAGGGTSLRGFRLNQAGPRSASGFPIGGEALLVFNQELRFPMRLPFVRADLGGALFYDAGNVFSTPGNIVLRSQPRQPGGDYFSHSIGLSFRYATPVGPVRIDLGYLLNPGEFFVTDPVTNVTQTRRLPRFQFFLNIGSMF